MAFRRRSYRWMRAAPAWAFLWVVTDGLRVTGSAAADQPPAARGPTDAELAAPLLQSTVKRAALARSAAIGAAHERARAMQTAAAAEGSLPEPELMAQVWQVPFEKPLAFDTQMIMFGVTQRFPALGANGARQKAMEARAKSEEAMGDDRGRLVARDAGHAFADYVESAARHRVHRAHQQVAEHLLAIAEARHGAGGSLTDATKASVELARVEADVVTDLTLIESARARINALLDRDPKASLGEPIEDDAQVPAWDLATLLAKAHETRPELRARHADKQAQAHALYAAEREATWPSFALGALYFPPAGMNPYHGYGASASVSLPWLWGGASARKAAQAQYLKASGSDIEATRVPIDTEVVAATTNAESSARRLRVLVSRTLEASRRAFDVARAGYESGRTDLLVVLDAERSVVDVDGDIVVARAALDHALTDLAAAVGTDVPTKPLPPLDSDIARPRDNHAH